MVEVIFHHNGTLDKFVGDEIMAVFGAPYPYKDHAEKACRTAMEMVRQLREIQKRWSADKKDFFHRCKFTRKDNKITYVEKESFGIL